MASEESIMHIPMENIRASAGFGIDIGGSLSKIVYRSKEDFKNGEPLKQGDANLGPVRLVSLPKANIDDVIRLLVDRCDYISDGTTTAYTTGFGANFYKNNIQDGLKVNTDNVSEFMAFVNVSNILAKTMSKSDLVLPISESAVQDGMELARSEDNEAFLLGQRPKLKKEDRKKLKQDLESRKEDKIKFPFLMPICGSGFLFLKVYDDSTFELLEFAAIGGRPFLGLSRVLTGAEDYDELWRAIESSDGQSVDILGEDLVAHSDKEKSDGEKDGYSQISPKKIIFPFGKGWTESKDSMKTGDMAWSVARMFSFQLSTEAWNVAVINDCKDVLFCGNFVAPKLVQDWIITETIDRRERSYARGRAVAERSPDVNFLRNGGYFGALGCFLYGQTDKQ